MVVSLTVSDDKEKKFVYLEQKFSTHLQWRKYGLQTIQEIVDVFAKDMKAKWKETYSNIHMYETMWNSFVSSVILQTLQWDWQLFHDYFVQKHGLKYESIYKDRRVFNQKNTKSYFDNFLQKIKEKGIIQWNPKILMEYDNGFYVNIISGNYNGDWNKFFKEFGYKKEEIGFEYKKIGKMTNEIRSERIKNFITYMEEQKITSFSPHTIKKYSWALSLDLERNFRTKDDKVDRQHILHTFFKDPEVIMKFTKLIELTNDIRSERFDKFITYMKERHLTFFSPVTIKKYSKALRSDLERNFRTEDDKIDRLYILYKFFRDPEIIKKFRHKRRREVDWRRKLDWIVYRAYRDDTYQYKNISPKETVETEYIEREEYMLYQEAIKKLSPLDQQIIATFLNEDEVDQENMTRIIVILRSLCHAL